MWEKIKSFVVKYKWPLGGLVAVVVLFLIFRKGSGSTNTGTTIISGTPVYSTGTTTTATDSNLAQQLQSQLDALKLNLDSQQHIADSQTDLERHSLDLQESLAKYTADNTKALAEITANTQLQLGQLQNQAAKYNVDVANIEANTAQAQIAANKYVAGKQADVARYQAHTNRYTGILGGLSSSIGTIGGLFK